MKRGRWALIGGPEYYFLTYEDSSFGMPLGLPGAAFDDLAALIREVRGEKTDPMPFAVSLLMRLTEDERQIAELTGDVASLKRHMREWAGRGGSE